MQFSIYGCGQCGKVINFSSLKEMEKRFLELKKEIGFHEMKIDFSDHSICLVKYD